MQTYTEQGRHLNGLALCAGVGGLELGCKLAMEDGYRTVCYVERETFAASVLVERMADQALDNAPIWDQLESFTRSTFSGRVDFLSSGYPCQPYSAAGKRRRYDTAWPEVFRIIKEFKPDFVFLENSPRANWEEVIEGLARRYNLAWDNFSCAAYGANHIRQRRYLLAHAHGSSLRLKHRRWFGAGWEEKEKPIGSFRWTTKPGVPRVDDGSSYRMDRSRTIGNSASPLVAANALAVLNERLAQ